jgi:multicomponent Na+:H+ antiporter subunit D
MPDPVAVSTAGGALLVWALIFPAAGALLALALGGRRAERIALALMPVGLGLAVAIAAGVLRANAALVYVVGGWAPPLGLALRADGAVGRDDDHHRGGDLRHRAVRPS